MITVFHKLSLVLKDCTLMHELTLLVTPVNTSSCSSSPCLLLNKLSDDEQSIVA